MIGLATDPDDSTQVATGAKDKGVAAPVSAPLPRPKPGAAPSRPRLAEDGPGSKKRTFSIAAVAALLLVAALAGGAFALIRSGDKDAEAPAPESTEASSTVGAASAESQAQSSDSSSEPSSPEAAAASPSTAAKEPASPFEEARSVFLAHWRAIDARDYATAYSYFSNSYELEEAAWVASKNEEVPDISVGSIQVRPSDHDTLPGELWLRVEVPTQDRGGTEAGNCRLFKGDIRMFRENGEWVYRPGEYRGFEPTLAVEDVPESENRCP